MERRKTKIKDVFSNFVYLCSCLYIKSPIYTLVMNKIIQNAMKTVDGTIITSGSVHDYVEYEGHSVDGGGDYFRYGYPSGCKDKIELLFLNENDSLEMKKKKLIWGTRGKDGKQPLKWVKLIECETDHLKAILKQVTPHQPHTEVIQSILEDRSIQMRVKKIKKLKDAI